MAGPLAKINPQLLIWARRSAGLSIDVAARKVPVTEARLRGWEAGTDQPTIAQLRKLGTAYKRPLVVFFLPAPPEGWDPMHDCRRLPGVEGEIEQTPKLRLAVRGAWERRAVAIELLGEAAGESGFDVASTPREDGEALASRIRLALDVSENEQRNWPTVEAALSRWRAAIEARGVLVFSFPGVDVTEVRGFSISAAPLPVVAMNSNDTPAGRCFTLMHELAHVAQRRGPVLCDYSRATDPDIEVYCNHVAGAVLVPRAALLGEPEVAAATASTRWDQERLRRLARVFSVSREVVARRLLHLQKMSEASYKQLRPQFLAEYAAWAAKKKTQKDNATGGPDFVTAKLSQYGRLYTGLVLSAYAEESITASAASEYLGVQVKYIGPFEEAVSRAG
jgi:Zn-dependent peptidase ImmA (M78 family)